MQRLPSFQYEPAHSVEHATALLATHGPQALVVSGGTDLYANMKQRLFTPAVVVGLRSINKLHFIRERNDGGLSIGALATLTDIADNPVVRTRYPALAQAALSISTPQLRNMGTIGGNVCLDTRCNYYNQDYDWRQALGFCMKKDGDVCRVALSSPKCVAVNSSDTAPVLQAYDAEVQLAGPRGRRSLKIADFFQNDGIRAWSRAHDEIVIGIDLPHVSTRTRSAYRKLRLRNSFDFPILGIAAIVERDAEGTCTNARVVLNAVASKPIDVPKAASALMGSRLDDADLDSASEAVFDCGRPLDNTSGSIPYRKRMLRVIARRTIADCA